MINYERNEADAAFLFYPLLKKGRMVIIYSECIISSNMTVMKLKVSEDSRLFDRFGDTGFIV